METLISLYEAAGYLGIFLFGFIGLIGLPIPNEVIVMTSGWMARLDVVDPLPAFLMTVLSLLAVVSTCYFAGKLFTNATTRFAEKRWWKRAFALFEKFENKALILSITLPGLRLAIPFLAGVRGIALPSFYRTVTIPVILWASGYFSLGFWYFPVASEQPLLFIPVFFLYVLAVAIRAWMTKKAEREAV